MSPDGMPSQFLLFRGLEATVTVQLLAKGAAKLYRTGTVPPTLQVPSTKKLGAKVSSTTAESKLGAKEGSLRRVLLVKDRWSDESWRFGFAEFASIEVRLRFLVLLTTLIQTAGLASCSGQVSLTGEIHNIVQARNVELYSYRGVHAGPESSTRK